MVQHDPHNDRTWAAVLETIQRTLGDEVYEAWFKLLKIDRFNDSVLHVSAPTMFVAKRVWDFYYYELSVAVCAQFGDTVTVHVAERRPRNTFSARSKEFSRRKDWSKREVAPSSRGVPLATRAPTAECTADVAAQTSVVDRTKRCVARAFRISVSDLESSSRIREHVWPRQIAMYLAREVSSSTLGEVGRSFGGRDHSTVMHAIEKVSSRLERDDGLKEEVAELRRQIKH